MKMRKIAILFCAVLFLCMYSQECMADKTDLSVGVGVIISPKYNDVLNDAYPDDQMYGAWLDLNLSFRRELIKGLALGPKVDLLADFVFGDYVNLIALPGLSVRYTFQAVPSVYLQGEIDYAFLHSGTGRFDFESGTVVYGGTVGYVFREGWYIEAGYLEIPVDVKLDKTSEVRKNLNLGGFLLRLGISF
jgi:hypothetical protein